jgi:hypothetical protein
VDWATESTAADVDAGAEPAAALLDDCAGVEAAEDVGAADVDVDVDVPPPHPDSSAASANADRPMLRCFFIAAP